MCSGLVKKALSKVHEETFFSDRVRNVSQQVTSCILLCISTLLHAVHIRRRNVD